MLSRLYIDNYRALVNAELKLGRRNLLMGRNGTGKSTFGEVLIALQLLLINQSKTDNIFDESTLTRWQRLPRQRFALEVEISQRVYSYELTIEHRYGPGLDESRTRVTTESLTLNAKPLFRFVDGIVRLFRNDHSPGAEYPFDWGRSALATIRPGPENEGVGEFLAWMRGLTVVRPNPQLMVDLIERDEFILVWDCANFAAWYRAMSNGDKRRDQELHKTLNDVLPGF
jgi:hypothetical protein